MKYFIDTEFIEGKQDKTILGIKYGTTKPTIDLISIGILAEDGREYYAISKDFNFKEAWNRFQLEDDNSVGARIGCLPSKKKVYWIRDNVLKPIFLYLLPNDIDLIAKYYRFIISARELNNTIIKLVAIRLFIYKNLKRLIDKYGKTNKQIAEEVREFVKCNCQKGIQQSCDHYDSNGKCNNKPTFYAYYADYDWVAFCWLFGKMIDLPKGFPMYCIDLKQEMDNRVNTCKLKVRSKTDGFSEREYFIGDHYNTRFQEMIKYIKEHKDYPKQTNEHNALADAKWNKQLYDFLSKLQ